MNYNLRSYGNGKFQNIVDQVPYEASMDGFGQETGDQDTFGYYILIKVDPTTTTTGYGDDLTTGERRFIKHHPWALVEMHSSGAVYVEWFKTEQAAQKAFDKVDAEYEEFCGDCDDENADDDEEYAWGA